MLARHALAAVSRGDERVQGGAEWRRAAQWDPNLRARRGAAVWPRCDGGARDGRPQPRPQQCEFILADVACAPWSWGVHSRSGGVKYINRSRRQRQSCAVQGQARLCPRQPLVACHRFPLITSLAL